MIRYPLANTGHIFKIFLSSHLPKEMRKDGIPKDVELGLIFT